MLKRQRRFIILWGERCVRTAIEKIGGTMPEDLPTPEKSIQQIEKEQMARLKAKARKGKLMLDE